MSKHTRPPWKKGNDCIIAEIDRHVPTLIAITGGYGMGIPAVIPDDEEAEANQRIMIAAPEMLEVLEELDECAAYWSEYNVPIGIHDRIKAAIAKAKGMQQ
jgi:type III secretory pathway component EscU